MSKILPGSLISVFALALGACQGAPPPVAEIAAPLQVVVAKPAPMPQPVAAMTVHPGEGVYKTFCAACHDQPEVSRAPAKDTLKKMSLQFLNYSLTGGKMKAQGAGLNADQRAQVVNYLIGNKVTSDAWTKPMMCDAARMPVDLTGAATITNFGFDRNNTRTLSAQQAGLTKAQISKMDLAWSLGFPDATTMRSQGAVVGKNVFLPVPDLGAMYALDVSDPAKPCIQWIYKSPGMRRCGRAPVMA